MSSGCGSVSLRRYVIEDFEQEGDCDECGWPLIVGDTAVDVDEGFAFCCGATCAKRHLARAARDAEVIRAAASDGRRNS